MWVGMDRGCALPWEGNTLLVFPLVYLFHNAQLNSQYQLRLPRKQFIFCAATAATGSAGTLQRPRPRVALLP